MSKEFWNERYSSEVYAYGESPNSFFKDELLKLKPGKILLPAEGEGRNAVFAAQLGWQVEAFDISKVGKTKALQLAKKNNVLINYLIDDFSKLTFGDNYFDAIGLVYAHFSPDTRLSYLKKMIPYLKQGGTVILEGFSKKNLALVIANPAIGGPRDLDMLYSIEEIESIFKEFNPVILEEKLVALQEGSGHSGTGSVIRFVGTKK